MKQKEERLRSVLRSASFLARTIWNGRRYRVAAPSIRIVPWTARASCWPLPQQLLPVSATGGGRRRCTLAIFSGRIIFISRLERPRLRSNESPSGAFKWQSGLH